MTAARPAPPATRATRPPQPVRRPALDRERRRLPEASLPPTPPSSLGLDQRASAAKSGRREIQEHLSEHNETGPVITAGDVDAYKYTLPSYANRNVTFTVQTAGVSLLTPSLTIYNASAGHHGLSVGFIWWVLGMILALGYFFFVYRMFRGKVHLEGEGY